jgi:UDP-glucose 4-epimerase
MKILVTGANGFVGGALLDRLVAERESYDVIASVRGECNLKTVFYQQVQIGDLSSFTDWSIALNQVDVVVHCAARVHIMKDDSKDPLKAYREVNFYGTLNLARQAALAGVRRFLFISSIKVNGEETQPGKPFTADELPSPLDPYGVSKFEAEEGLRTIEEETGMEVVIVRPPLVYGPGVKANFASMLRLVELGIPIPLGSIHNARSMVALDNLTDFLVTCINHPAAAGQTFLVSDGEDVSTTDLLKRTAHAMGKHALLIPIPDFIIKSVAVLLGKRAVVNRLCGSLQVDINKASRLLGWSPPLTLDQGLKKTVEGMKW